MSRQRILDFSLCCRGLCTGGSVRGPGRQPSGADMMSEFGRDPLADMQYGTRGLLGASEAACLGGLAGCSRGTLWFITCWLGCSCVLVLRNTHAALLHYVCCGIICCWRSMPVEMQMCLELPEWYCYNVSRTHILDCSVRTSWHVHRWKCAWP